MNPPTFFMLSMLSILFGALPPVHSADQTLETYIQVRLVDTKQHDSLAFMEVIGSKKRFALQREILLNLSHIENATSSMISASSPYINLTLKCTPTGTDKLKEISNTYRKKRVGIIINEDLVGAPAIIGEIRNGMIGIPIKQPKEFVDQMAERINRAISKYQKQ